VSAAADTIRDALAYYTGGQGDSGYRARAALAALDHLAAAEAQRDTLAEVAQALIDRAALVHWNTLELTRLKIALTAVTPTEAKP
jgi:hypothetical protein